MSELRMSELGTSEPNCRDADQKTQEFEQSRSRLISKILSPAVRLWLRSQLEAAEVLQFQIGGGDRQILSGFVPSVTIAAEQVVYQGIAIRQISAVAKDIRINLREVLRGKPLRLLEVVPVQTAVQLTEPDLNASLQTPLLSQALTKLLLDWLQAAAPDGLPDPLDRILQDSPVSLHHLQVQLRQAQLVLAGTLTSTKQQSMSLAIGTGLQVVQGNRLQLDFPQWLLHWSDNQGKPLPHLHGYEIHLGTDVNIQQLALQEGQIICRGSINVLP